MNIRYSSYSVPGIIRYKEGVSRVCRHRLWLVPTPLGSIPQIRRSATTHAMNEADKRKGCSGRFREEWSLGSFSLDEVDGRTVDESATFQPKPRIAWICFKAFAFLWSISVLFAHLRKYDVVSFYLAYSSHWAFVLTIIYQLLSLLAACLPTGKRSTAWISRAVMCLGPTVAGMELIVTFIFWTTDRQFEPEVGQTLYNNLTLHGIFLSMVLLDLLVVNRSPVRPKHILGMYLYTTLYMIWMILHAALKVGNPRTNGEDIYDNVSWANKPVITVVFFLVNYLVLVPLAFAFIFVLSGGGCCGLIGNYRRYAPTGTTSASEGVVAATDAEVEVSEENKSKQGIEMC